MRIVRPRQPFALEIIARARRRSAAVERVTAKGDGQATGERPQEGRTARRQRRAPGDTGQAAPARLLVDPDQARPIGAAVECRCKQ